MNKRELRYQPARELRVQTSPDGTRTISGYAIRYNEPSQDMGGFVEIVAPGAATDSLKSNPDVLCLRDHDQTLLMGRTKAKTLTLLENSAGVQFTCKLPGTAQASDLATSIERGDLDGVSFGFVTVKDKWSSDASGSVVRTLLQVKLLEVSPCSFPAYPSTSVSVRSCPKELRSIIRSRSEDEDEDDECDCDCPECQDGDCTDCSNTDCDSEDCDHGENSTRSMDLWQLNMQLAIAQRR